MKKNEKGQDMEKESRRRRKGGIRTRTIGTRLAARAHLSDLILSQTESPPSSLAGNYRQK